MGIVERELVADTPEHAPSDTPPAIRPLSHQSTNDAVLALARLAPASRLLDVGAGEGYFSQLVGEHVKRAFRVPASAVVTACDVRPDIYRYPDVRCDPLGDDGALPYADASFDVVCSLEVIEHVQDQFRFCRELVRVLKPGGTLILSTPNILNMNSRYRNLHSGFATLFNPLSMSAVDVVHTSGHINPISYYYLAYALRHAGARAVRVTFDRFKRSALLPLVLFAPFLLLGHAGFRAKLRRKSPQTYAENEEYLRAMQSIRMLTSRSIIVVATR